MKPLRCPRPRHFAIFAVVLALAAMSATPAAAAGSLWTKAGDLSAKEVNGQAPQVAIAEDGSAVAVWVVRDPNPAVAKNRVQFAVRERGGNFNVPAPRQPGETEAQHIARVEQTYLSDPGQEVTTHVRLKMNKDGKAIVVWEGTDGSVRSAFKPADGEFGDEQVAVAAFAGRPEVGIDDDGASTLIYQGTGTRANSVYREKDRGDGETAFWAGGSDPGDEMIEHPNGFGGTGDANAINYKELNGSLAVDGAGNATAVFSADTNPTEPFGTNDERIIELYSPDPNGAGRTWLFSGEQDRGGTNFYSTHALIQGDTRLIAWTLGGNLKDVYRDQNDPSGNRDTINDPGDGPSLTSGSAFTLDDDRALAMWSSGGGGGLQLRARYAASFGDPGPNLSGDPVPGADGAGRTRPRLATDGDGDVMTVFKQVAGGKSSIMAALRPKTTSLLKFNEPMSVVGADDTERTGAPVAISEPCDFNITNCGLEPDADTTDPGPNIAMNSRGEAVVAWAQQDGDTNKVVKTSLYIPRPEEGEEPVPVPPPPPPRPEPSVPSLIQTARPAGVGQATVLTLKSGEQGGKSDTEGANKLDWGFGSKDEPPITGEMVNGNLERSVRLRLPNQTFTATARVQTPGGPLTFKRDFTLAALPTAGPAGDVAARLKRAATPPVFAVGATDTLIKASKACAPMKVWSGQQKMSGCMKPIENLGDIPDPESGALKDLATELKLDEKSKEVMQKANELTDGYVSEGRALLNDKFPVIPGGPASVLFNPQAKLMASANATIPVGGVGGSYDLKKGFSLTFDPKQAKIPLGKLPKVPKLPSLAGLQIVGDWDVDLEKQEAKIKASVKLPPAIKKAGAQISNEVNLRATPDRVIVDEARVGPIDVNIAGLAVNKFQIQYKREPDQWDGQGKACLIGTACLDMLPPNGGVTIRNGTLSRAGASLIFPPPGIPLYAGVNLERVGFGIGLEPTRIFGSARVGVAQFIKLDGRIFVAFPTTQNPFILDRKEVGDAYPPHLYGQRFNRFTFGASADAIVDVPVIGETRLGSAYALYEYPGYVAFGGGYDARVLGILTLRGGVAAEADAEKNAFDIHGEVKACIELDPLSLCSGATGHVSRGPGGTGGAGACLDVGFVSVGGGVRWNDLSDPYIWPIDGCKWSPFRIQVRQSAGASKAKGKQASADRLVKASSSRKVRARESQVGVRGPGVYTVKVEKDKPNPVLRLDGRGGAPAIRVSGPGGTLEAPADKGFAVSPDRTLRVMRFKNQYANITSVGFQGAKPGVYTVQTLPGSAAVVSVQQATDPPDAKVTGKVTGKGRNRVLRYDVRRRVAQNVIFSEITATGASRVIGRTSGGKGRIRFRSAPGYGRRTIQAQFELSGIPGERKRFAAFTPQSPVIARPRGVRVRRKGSRLLVSWKKVPGASNYELAASPSSRRMAFASTRGTRASIAMPRWVSGGVTVRAIDNLRESAPTAPKRFAATGSQPSPFRTLQRCKIGKNKIECLPPKRICAGRRATIVAEPGRVTRGTARKDVIVGTDDNDRIEGLGGDDLICGGRGDDTVLGGQGGDRLRGGAGRDVLLGGPGDDRLRGGPEDDRLNGEAGNDRLRGDAGNDSITGDSGRDKLSSGPNTDLLVGGDGNDRLNGGRGKDRLNGGRGRDRLRDGSKDRARSSGR